MRYGRAFPARPIINVVEITIYEVPAAPINLTAAVSNFYVTLTWTDVSTTNTSYTLERKKGAGAYSTLSSSIPGSTSTYPDPTALEMGATYTYRLTAWQSGVFSSSATVTVGIPPEEHTSLQAFPKSDVTGNVSVQLMWDKNARYENGTLVERSTDNVSWSTITTTAKGATTYEDTGLTANTLYYYRVSAVGSAATSITTGTTVTTKLNSTAGLSYPFQKKVRAFPRE